MNDLYEYTYEEALKVVDEKVANGIKECFKFLFELKETQGCLYSSIINFAVLSYYGYKPKLCYGLCTNDGYEFYHSWIELDNKILDLAIFGNTNYNELNQGSVLDKPVVFGENEHIRYNDRMFDEDWSKAGIYMIQFTRMSEYVIGCDNAWKKQGKHFLKVMLNCIDKKSLNKNKIKEEVFKLMDSYDDEIRRL